MIKRFTPFPCVFLAMWILSGCGNKGDLFLPSDPQLAKELEAASTRTNDADTDVTDDATNKKKKPVQ